MNAEIVPEVNHGFKVRLGLKNQNTNFIVKASKILRILSIT